MAAPVTLTTRDITGKYVLASTRFCYRQKEVHTDRHDPQNAKLSDPNAVEEILRLQGVSWVLRKAITLATVTLLIKHYSDKRGVERIEITNTLTGGIPGTTELSVLDWTDLPHEDYVFGKVLGRSKRVDSLNVIEDPFLKEGWDVSQAKREDGVILFYAESVGGSKSWTAEEVRWLCTILESFRCLPALLFRRS